ncbi:helix-turn-helix transcriptional regulator [Cellvibrio sp. OA-2007]|uniref:helix-turn-helix transcriptional regulator n=1 Tax=Cellvibrio sp. OA-2007 TaxID=529823 RepID=UPI0007827379|nr:LuxR C-terminal-related transcriptional regulator [Cellvibrio sp. OA-2007]
MGGYELGEYESRLIAAIYEAALESTKWQSVLLEVCKFVDADAASLVFYDQQHSQRNFTITAHNTNHNDDAVRDHLAKDFQRVKNLFSNLIPGQIFTTKNLFPQTDLPLNSQACNQVDATGDRSYTLRAGIPLVLGDIIFSTINIYSFSDTEDLPLKAIEFIERLSPHFVRAIYIHNHLSVLRRESDCLLEAIKRTNLAVFLLDASLRVVFASPEAQRVLANHPALSLNRNMRLQAHIAKEHLRLESILTDFLDEGFRANYVVTEGICLPLLHPAKTHPLKLCFIPIQQQARVLTSDIPCLAVFANDPERQRFISPQYLQQAYGLTVTETQLAQLLLRGMGVADISHERGTSPETTRWQVKQMMHKTQTHSQTELTRLLTLLTNEFANDKQSISGSDRIN